MIRHVALFAWTSAADRRAEKAGGYRITRPAAAHDRGRAYHVGPDAGLAEGNFDFAVVGDFEDAASYAAYRNHPAPRPSSSRPSSRSCATRGHPVRAISRSAGQRARPAIAGQGPGRSGLRAPRQRRPGSERRLPAAPSGRAWWPRRSRARRASRGSTFAREEPGRRHLALVEGLSAGGRRSSSRASATSAWRSSSQPMTRSPRASSSRVVLRPDLVDVGALARRRRRGSRPSRSTMACTSASGPGRARPLRLEPPVARVALDELLIWPSSTAAPGPCPGRSCGRTSPCPGSRWCPRTGCRSSRPGRTARSGSPAGSPEPPKVCSDSAEQLVRPLRADALDDRQQQVVEPATAGRRRHSAGVGQPASASCRVAV